MHFFIQREMNKHKSAGWAGGGLISTIENNHNLPASMRELSNEWEFSTTCLPKNRNIIEMESIHILYRFYLRIIPLHVKSGQSDYFPCSRYCGVHCPPSLHHYYNVEFFWKSSCCFSKVTKPYCCSYVISLPVPVKNPRNNT